jgi:hypothetical protein
VLCVIIGDDRLQFVYRRNMKHAATEGGGTRERLAVPSQMFAHAMKLTWPVQRFKLTGMIEDELKPLGE